ncbi:Raf kinase inhibitor-like protein, YbhB/YbcL family [Chitinophaga jiangningensis]|uniref:Raf kinase inhibitor-like protein, YbhB/YbcL family n=1 Tax=Chitinophaga jiangningensis TaxID=1419482 RepID=A0A1M7KCV8_9BACT|nr:YbhB/YbcL family Raf kinase inhibitor-like protein [Chitinophaga jiangningensis]SHM63083.1 Raf kinase inhibitor-like protein, YbhB/YbcL family [Chitinophaga jiangningensis]
MSLTNGQLVISSRVCREGNIIPYKYSCAGENINPPLEVNGIPPGAASIAVVLEDMDAPLGKWVHWLVWNMPVSHRICENYTPVILGKNDFGQVRYTGFCPGKMLHHYHFTVFALAKLLNLGPGGSWDDLRIEMAGHVLATGVFDCIALTKSAYYDKSENKIAMTTITFKDIYTQESTACITLIIPLQPVAGYSREADAHVLDKMVGKVTGFLHEMYPMKESAVLLANLYELAALLKADDRPALQGAGLYVSARYKKLLLFPFPVKEKVVIAGKFSVREALQLEQYSVDYILLHADSKRVMCYKGKLEELEEIQDHNFPRLYQEEYEYAKPSRSSSLAGYAGEKNFEKDKSLLQADRRRRFFIQADKALSAYLGQLPLVLAGPKKDMAQLEEVTHHSKNIIARIPGNYFHVGRDKLAAKVWPLVREWLDGRDRQVISSFLESIGQGNTVEGVKAVWEAARDGQVAKLLIEKNFACSGFTDKNGKIYLRAPEKPHHIEMDIPEEIMRMVIKKGGQVLFVEDNALDLHGGIAAITWY